VTSFAALRPSAARGGPSDPVAWADATSLWLGVPFRTQIDGTEFSLVNCGPASLSMVLATFGIEVGAASIRDFVNYLSGDYSTDDGTSLHILARVAREAGLNTFGVANTWSVDAVRQHVLAGHPVITLVKYRSLPGHGASLAEFDHYVVITGVAGNDFIYNDSAFASDYGDSLLISPRELELGWSYSSTPNHAVAVGLGTSPRPLPATSRALSAASLALPPSRVGNPATPPVEPDMSGELRPDELRPEEVMTETPLAMVPGPAAQWIHERMLAEVGARAAPRERPVDATPLFQPSATMLEAFRDTGDSTRVAGQDAGRSVGEAATVHSPIVEAAMAALPSASLDPPLVDAAGSPTPRTPHAVYLVLMLVLGLVVRRHRPGVSQRP